MGRIHKVGLRLGWAMSTLKLWHTRQMAKQKYTGKIRNSMRLRETEIATNAKSFKFLTIKATSSRVFIQHLLLFQNFTYTNSNNHQKTPHELTIVTFLIEKDFTFLLKKVKKLVQVSRLLFFGARIQTQTYGFRAYIPNCHTVLLLSHLVPF